ncbi:hypothetical protein [Anaeroselena agilis]|uniref:Uncharacterized protein n=1 Tax=Anaeroselena agilis TaxID=3063788 RepID=A0ABU3NTB8_9FIRM|nr:hypothetical protein [Selenomonadales bacterium 4137-cl]
MSKKITVAILFAMLLSVPFGLSYFAGKDAVSGMSANKAVAFYHNTSPDCNDHV